MVSELSSYRKRILRDMFFNVLGYNRLVSKNVHKSELDKNKRLMQLEYARSKLMKKLDGGSEYDMSYWRRCESVDDISYLGSTCTLSVDGGAPSCEPPDNLPGSDSVDHPLQHTSESGSVFAHAINRPAHPSSVNSDHGSVIDLVVP